MQETSSLYKRLLADPGHWKEYTLVIGESGVLVTNQGDRITFGSKPYSAEVRGSVIQLEGTTENPLTGLTIFGKTTQAGTPTPEAPVELVSVGNDGSVYVDVAGANLVDIPDFELVKPSNRTFTYHLTRPLPAGTYYFACEGSGTSASTCVRLENNTVEMRNDARIESGGTVKITADYEIHKLYFYIAARQPDGTTTSVRNVILSTAPVAYEPYKEQQSLIVSTPNGLPGIPVDSGGNYTDEMGQQWVCDEVDFARGVYVQRVGHIEDIINGYTSSGEFTAIQTEGYRKFRIINPAIANIKSTDKSMWGWCNRFPVKTIAQSVTTAANAGTCVAWSKTSNGIYFVVPSEQFDSANSLVTFLQNNPTEILYELAEENHISLSAEELAQYAALHTNYPNTTIFNDGGADMIVGYLLNGEGPINILVASSSADSGFRESSIISMSTQKSIFSESNLSVGNCIAGQITVDMMKPKGDIPRRARLSPYVRLTNGVEHSEWIQKGVFFIDHREYSGDENERMTVYGYDHIILAEEEFPSSAHTWPRKDIDVVRDIASEIGTTLDSRTVKIINKGYLINYPAGYSMREVLENIAAMYAGSFIMSDTGELLLVTMFGIPRETSYLIDNVGFAITFGGERILV